MTDQYDFKDDAKSLASAIFGVLEMCEKGASLQEIHDFLILGELGVIAATVINDGQTTCAPIDLGPSLSVIQGGKP